MNEKQLQWIESNLDLHNFDLVAWIIPKDALSSCFSTQGIT